MKPRERWADYGNQNIFFFLVLLFLFYFVGGEGKGWWKNIVCTYVQLGDLKNE